MKKDKSKEQIFIKKIEKGEFNFSYSSLNKLTFSPSLFYKDYILMDREIRTDKHLIEGKLLHLMILQPEKLHDEFSITPSKMPSDTLRKVLKNITLYTDVTELVLVEDKIILDSLRAVGLYQSLKDSDKRIAKVRTTECDDYFAFESNTDGKDVIDNDMLLKATERVELIKNNKSIMELLSSEPTDFEMDGLEVFNEAYLKCTLEGHNFGLHGYIDRYVIDHDKKEITIIDVKTTGKTISDFPETVQFYNYWLQAAVYVTLISKNIGKKEENYKINFNFIVIDKYNQMYNFPVSINTMNTWGDGLMQTLKMVEFHIKENNYDLPYQFLQKKKVIL
jgi:hypothetical protein